MFLHQIDKKKISHKLLFALFIFYPLMRINGNRTPQFNILFIELESRISDKDIGKESAIFM